MMMATERRKFCAAATAAAELQQEEAKKGTASSSCAGLEEHPIHTVDPTTQSVGSKPLVSVDLLNISES